MALSTTATLPETLNHPRPPKPLMGSDKKAIDEHNKELARYVRETQLMIEKFYNDLHRNIEGFNMVGLDADLPAPGFPGRQFTATDSKKFYKDIGSSWIAVTLA